MKKIIYSIINDDEIGINLKDDIKLNIFRVLDNVKSNIKCFLHEPINIKDNNIDRYSIKFMSDDYRVTGCYIMSTDCKVLLFTYISDIKNFKSMEEYKVIKNSSGLIEYRSRLFNKDKEVVEYYYEGNEITEEEAQKIIRGKSK